MRTAFGLLVLLLAPAASATSQEVSGGEGSRLKLEGGSHLPLQKLEPVLERLDLRRHALPQVALAYYQPQLALHPDGARPVAEAWRGQLWLRSSLQGADPRGRAAQQLTREGDGVTVLPLLSATPDVVEPVMYSLILAALHFRMDSQADFGAQVDRFAGGFERSAEGAAASGGAGAGSRDAVRAEILMASASFGAHLLVLANEMERSRQRRLASGKAGLCAQLRAGAGLFSLWQKAFSEAPFPVTTFDAAGREQTRDVSSAQRRWVVRELFSGGGWQGSLSDHEALCS